MKRALTKVVSVLIVSGALVLSFSDSDRDRSAADPASTPRFEPGHGDYPTHGPIAAGSRTGPQKLACLTPDLRRPRHRIG